MIGSGHLKFLHLSALTLVLLVLSIALGGIGPVEGDLTVRHQIAKVLFPLFELTVLVMAMLGVVYLVRRGRRS